MRKYHISSQTIRHVLQFSSLNLTFKYLGEQFLIPNTNKDVEISNKSNATVALVIKNDEIIPNFTILCEGLNYIETSPNRMTMFKSTGIYHLDKVNLKRLVFIMLLCLFSQR